MQRPPRVSKRRDTSLPVGVTVFARSISTSLPFLPAVRSLCAAPHTRVPKRSPPPASSLARAGTVRSFRTSDSNTQSAPHALFPPPGIVPGHPPFLARTHSGSQVFSPAPSGRRLASPWVFLDSPPWQRRILFADQPHLLAKRFPNHADSARPRDR